MGGVDFLHLAVRLSGGATEAEWRSAVSRACYGAFHLALNLVESCGVTLPKTADAHEKLQWCLVHAGNSRLPPVVERLNSLRAARNVADYDLTSSKFTKRGSVAVAITRAQQIVDALALVRSQSDFAETRSAIREYASGTLRLPVTGTD
jgi:hypothetical protein